MSKRHKVTYDPGHGGHDSGAIHKKTGLKESDNVLDICLRAFRLASPYFDVFLTRDDDTFLPLKKRATLSNKVGAVLFYSVHLNSSKSKKTLSSWEVFTTRGQNRSDGAADDVGFYQSKIFPEMHARVDRSDGDLDKESNFTVLVPTDHPSVLMEFEFINTDHGAKRIADPIEREKMAYVLVLSTLKTLGLHGSESALWAEFEFWNEGRTSAGGDVSREELDALDREVTLEDRVVALEERVFR